MSGEAPLQPQEHDVGSADDVFSSVDHGEVERPELVDQPDLDAQGEPLEPEPACTPLADTFVLLTRIACRLLDESSPLLDSEAAELLDASAALERRYAPELQRMGDAALWARFSITVGVVAQPRVAAHLRRKREAAEAAATAKLQPSPAPAAEPDGEV